METAGKINLFLIKKVILNLFDDDQDHNYNEKVSGYYC